MATPYDEEHYVENPFLDHLRSLGWDVYIQNKSNPEVAYNFIDLDSNRGKILGPEKKFRETFAEVFLENELKSSIRNMNPWLEDDQVNDVFGSLSRMQENSLLESNMAIHYALLENMTVSENRETKQTSPSVKLIDFEDPHKNSFIAISQFKVNIPGTESHIIPDIVLFVNGIPLVIVECKAPSITEPIRTAVDQIVDYSNRTFRRAGNEKLFYSNIFCIATTMQEAKYGTITSEYEDYFEWKDPYPFSLSDLPSKQEPVKAQEILIQGMLSKENLLSILHSYVIFKENSSGALTKIVPRYQQFRTAKKIASRIRSSKEREKKGGIVWHTQGSGKSLTMMFTIRELYHHPETMGFKIVMLTDRRDLERQLKDTARAVGYSVKVASGVDNLKELLRSDTPELIMAMIHKFQEREFDEEFPILNRSSKILIMIDEAHRTQYKILGANLERSLPNAVKVAFTGTPIAKTEQTFGNCIDRYTIKQAVEDGVTVDIVYEGRTHQATIRDPDEANRKFEDVFSILDDDQRRLVIGKYTKKSYLEAEEVIRDKAKDMIQHYLEHVFPNGFKAQVVAASRRAAVRYKRAFDHILEESTQNCELEESVRNRLGNLRVEVVISGSPHEVDSELSDFINEEKHESIIKSFNLPFSSNNGGPLNGDVGIIVVNEMLITGFDAPIEQVMYLDNVIREHNLLQAIARVNRKYRNKTAGFVVDYVGVTDHLKEALSIYMQDDIDQITSVFINKSLSIERMRAALESIDSFFENLGIKDWKNQVDECIDILSDDETREEFNNLSRVFMNNLDRILPDPQALGYLSILKRISFIKEAAKNRYRDEKLSVRDASMKIRGIVEEYLISNGVDPRVPPTPLFSGTFLLGIENKRPKTKAEELRYAIAEHIEKNKDKDPELYERFSDRLQKILEEYKQNWERIAQELEILREKMQQGREAEKDFGLDAKTEMPFFGLLKQIIYPETKMDQLDEKKTDRLVALTRDIVDITLREARSVDFWENPSKVKRLKSFIVNHILSKERDLFNQRNEIAQRSIELAFNVLRPNS